MLARVKLKGIDGGDIEAKDPRYGGNPGVVIATPDIKTFKIQDSYDFILMGCDGVFEKL